MIEAVLRRSEGRLYRGYARVYVRRHGDVDDDFRTEISFIQDLVITEESIGYEDSYGQLHPIEVRSDCLFSLRQLSKEERKFLYHEAVLNAMDYRVVFYMRSIAGEARLVRQYENQYISPILKQSGRSQYQVQLSMLFSPDEANEHFEIVEPPQSPVYVYPENDNVVLRSSEQVRVRVRVQVGGRLFLGVRVRGSVFVLQEWNEVADVMNGWVLSGVSGYLEKEFVYGGGESGVLYEFFGRVRYFNQDSFETTRLVCRRFSAPSLSDYPTSIVYPTNTLFQVTAQRNTANANNANANQVEFEWRIGVDVQGIVSSVYNNAGRATGTFQIPSGLNSGNTIFVKARSRNSVVIGEWSNEIEISVTLFRPLPNILSFTASQSKVALSAQPPTQVFFSIQFSYNDAFSGICTWKIERVDNMQLISSGVQTRNPQFVSNISVPLPSVSSKTTLTYRLTVTNPNNQSVTSDVQIEYIPRPSFLDSEVFFFFNPNLKAYQDVSKTALANRDGDPVGLIEDEIDSTRKVEQQTVTNKPVLKASGNRFFLESSVAGRNLRQPASDNALPTDFSQRDNFSWIMVGNFPDRRGEICQPMNLANGTIDVILGFLDSGVRFRLGIFVSSDIILPNTPYNTHNVMQVVVVTYQRNATNGFKVYSSLYPTSNGRLVDQKNTNDNILGGSNNDRMMICRSLVTDSTFPRRVGHVISFKKTLSQSEALAWIDWLCAYYQITPAP